MQLSVDRLDIEESDFEYLRYLFDTVGGVKLLGLSPNTSFIDYSREAAQECTLGINRRLSFFSKGKKSKNTLQTSVLILGHLWKHGTPKKQIGMHDWVARKYIFSSIARHRQVGRPEKPDPVLKNRKNPKKKPTSESEELPHPTAIERALKGLIEVGLIERKTEIINNEQKPDKKKENTFYRISNAATSNVITINEEYQKLYQLFLQTEFKRMDAQNRLLATIWFMKKNGMKCSVEDIDKLVEDWRKEAFKGGHAIKPEIMGVIPNF